MTEQLIEAEEYDRFDARLALLAYLNGHGDQPWELEDVAALLHKMADFYWADRGDEWRGFMIAGTALRIAADATLIERGETLAERFLHHIGHAAAFLAACVDGGDEWVALRAIADTTKHWAWIVFDGAMRPATGLRGMSDEAMRKVLRG